MLLKVVHLLGSAEEHETFNCYFVHKHGDFISCLVSVLFV